MDRIRVEGWHGRVEFDGSVLTFYSSRLPAGKQSVPGSLVTTIPMRNITSVTLSLREGEEGQGYWPPGRFSVTFLGAGSSGGMGFDHGQAPAFERLHELVL